MPAGTTTYTGGLDVNPINVYPLGDYAGTTSSNYQFDFIAPAGELDSLSNNLKVGDLVFVNATGTCRKIQAGSVITPQATLQGTQIGVVTGIQVGGLKNYYSEYDFTADDGIITVLTGRNIEWYGDLVSIYNVVTGGADTRVPFNFTTHATGAAPLAGLVKVHGKANNRDSFSFA